MTTKTENAKKIAYKTAFWATTLTVGFALGYTLVKLGRASVQNGVGETVGEAVTETVQAMFK